MLSAQTQRLRIRRLSLLVRGWEFVSVVAIICPSLELRLVFALAMALDHKRLLSHMVTLTFDFPLVNRGLVLTFRETIQASGVPLYSLVSWEMRLRAFLG